MALTNVQNEFLKMQLANNPEFKSEYFPNVITQAPRGPLYNVDYQSDRPSNVFYESNPDSPVKPGIPSLPSDKYSEFREINVPYDSPGSRLNIKDIVPNSFNMLEPGRERFQYAHVKPAELYHEGQPVHGDQTQTVYVNPDILASYGTDPSSPRNEMVNTPEWYKQAAADFGGIKIEPTVDQAKLNDFIEIMLGHEVGHGVADLPMYAQDSSEAETFDMSEFVPSNLRQGHKFKEGYGVGPPQVELYNRMRDIERLKIENPDDYEDHPFWELYQNRAKMNFANMTGQNWYGQNKLYGFNKYQDKIKPYINAYFDKVTLPQQAEAFQAAGAWSPQVQQDPGGGGTWHAQTAAKEAVGEKVAGPGFGKGAYFSRGGRIGLRRGTSGAPGGGDPGMTSDPSGKGQTFGGGYTGGWSPGVQHSGMPKTKTITPKDSRGSNIKTGPYFGSTINYQKTLNPFKNWKQHAIFSNILKDQGIPGDDIPNYHQIAAHDFDKRFGLPNFLSKGLATAYQYGSEGFKALKEGTDLDTARDTAAEESRLNRLGIEGLNSSDMANYQKAFDYTNINSLDDQRTWQAKYLSRGGILGAF